MTAYKLVALGAGAVGKSAVVNRFVHDHFVMDYDPTIEDCYKRSLVIGDETVQVDIIDTAGQDDFKQIHTSYMRQSDGFLILYAVDDRMSFEEAREYHERIVMTRGVNVRVVVCGNKSDLPSEKHVITMEEGEAFAESIGAKFFETSALKNTNINEAFNELTGMVHVSLGGRRKKLCLLI